MDKKLISIISPVFNEEKNLVAFCQELFKVFLFLDERYDFELILVNDGSNDQGEKIIEEMAGKEPRIKYLGLSRNFGKEIALSCGVGHAQGEAMITLDSDLQHPPALIPEFLAKWEKGAEIVIGVRKKSEKQGFTRKIASGVFCGIMNLIGETKIMPGETDFRLVDRTVAKEFNRFTERQRLFRGLIDWLGFKKDYVFFEAEARKSGKAGYGFMKLVHLAFSGFISQSLFPLKVAGYLGVFITLFSGILGVFMFVNKFIFHDPFRLAFSNVTMLAVLITFLIGIVLICLGLIALYIASIHSEVINRPIYVIRRRKNI
ncbi:MAG: glycosyltransferase family 2 protein [bacterium]|nr:glycosyltransferase family 2 protein [bacterium]